MCKSILNNYDFTLERAKSIQVATFAKWMRWIGCTEKLQSERIIEGEPLIFFKLMVWMNVWDLIAVFPDELPFKLCKAKVNVCENKCMRLIPLHWVMLDVRWNDHINDLVDVGLFPSHTCFSTSKYWSSRRSAESSWLNTFLVCRGIPTKGEKCAF